MGKHVTRRQPDHQSHKNTTSLFGLVHAILGFKYGDEFVVQGFQLLRIWDKDHVDLAEGAMSVLASSYYFLGGLNWVLAGGAHRDLLKDLKMDKWWEDNYGAVMNGKVYKQSLDFDEAKLAKMEKFWADIRNLQDSLKTAKRKEEENEETEKRLIEMWKEKDILETMLKLNMTFDECARDYLYRIGEILKYPAREARKAAVAKDSSQIQIKD